MTGIRLFRLAVGVALALGVTTSSATTWRVERDGSGDFGVIQDAVDVAASGDTIRIGAGRFDEKQYFSCPGWSDSVRVVVSQHELTLIGSGPETIIGQVEPWELEQGNHKGIVAGDYLGNKIIRIEKLHMENMHHAFYSSYESDGADTVIARNCSFYGNWISAFMVGDRGVARIEDCLFNHMARDGIHVYANGQGELEISACAFRLWDVHTWPQKHLSFFNVFNANILNCVFHEGATGATIAFGGNTTFTNCQFDGQSIACLTPSEQSNVTIDSCHFRNQDNVVQSSLSNNNIQMRDSVVENVSDCSILLSHVGPLSVHACDLAHGARGAVWVQDSWNCTDPIVLDMTDNYWGTDDPDSIAALIRDFNDSDQACYIVDFEPFRNESTLVESKSLSDLKSLFR